MMKTFLGATALCSAFCTSADAACTVTATDIIFPDYFPLSGSVSDSAGNITVDCQNPGLVGLLVTVSISLSTGSGGSYMPRTMLKGTDTLNYNLYTNAGRTTVWGDGTGGTSTIGYTLLLPILGNDNRTDPYYGRIPAGQTGAIPGTYNDTITVTVDYLGL